MAKAKKSTRINRMSAPLKLQSKQEKDINVLKELEQQMISERNKKWLNLVLTVSATDIVAKQSYGLFRDYGTTSNGQLPSYANNFLTQLKRKGKEIDTLIDKFRLIIKREIHESEYFHHFMRSSNLDIWDNNFEIQYKFLTTLLQKVDAGRVELYMSALSDEVDKGWPLLLRADLRIFLVKTDKTLDYVPMNIMTLEEMSYKINIEDIKYVDNQTGSCKKMSKAMIKKLHNKKEYEGLDLSWIDNNLKNIK